MTLELDDSGGIIGPKLSSSDSPTTKVMHPKAGIGLLEVEPLISPVGDTFISYYFPDDPKTYIVTQGPNRGMRMKSIHNVFLKE